VRAGLGHTGFVASGAVRVNIDRWSKDGNRPNNIGGLVQIAYSPQPEIVVAAVKVPPPMAPEPAPEPPAPAPVSPGPGPAPAPVLEPAPAPRPATSTTDEVLFDSGKSRLTNIAKAILDGVALRLKNNISATCTITGYTDPNEKGGDHNALARARAEAAKDYLVKRHGIDAARIQVSAKGDAEAGADSTRNRRATVTVTFP
jgi:outer membrane protein OmpA-like peptidoglycan-associated protein